jgi:hypothetical protein
VKRERTEGEGEVGLSRRRASGSWVPVRKERGRTSFESHVLNENEYNERDEQITLLYSRNPKLIFNINFWKSNTLN